MANGSRIRITSGPHEGSFGYIVGVGPDDDYPIVVDVDGEVAFVELSEREFEFTARRAPVPIASSRSQPPPLTNDGDPVYQLVRNDLELRAEEGLKKYGTYLQANNGRDALVDAYQEALDLCLYLRQKIEEAA